MTHIYESKRINLAAIKTDSWILHKGTCKLWYIWSFISNQFTHYLILLHLASANKKSYIFQRKKNIIIFWDLSVLYSGIYLSYNVTGYQFTLFNIPIPCFPCVKLPVVIHLSIRTLNGWTIWVNYYMKELCNHSIEMMTGRILLYI